MFTKLGAGYLFIFTRFEEIRAEKGITKTFLAEKLKRKPTIFQDWKYGKSTPNVTQLRIIARELGTTPEYLTGETDEKYSAREMDGEFNHLSDVYDDLWPENRKRLEEFAEFLQTLQRKQDPPEKASKSGR